MANQEHLDVLAKGVEAWNAWRVENPYLTPDLSHENGVWAGPVPPLSGVDFSGAFLSRIDLREAHLVTADFEQANLEYAVMGGAVAFRGNFTGANLRHADLQHAILNGASFRLADLRGTNLAAARLDSVDFTDAVMNGTLVDDTDLSTVSGLETVRHIGPSSIGLDTIYRSGGKIPEIFLRRAGVPDNFITYMRSLTGAAFDFYSCFISYSTKDQVFADRLYADLQAKGVRCWLAPHDIQGGRKLHEQIDEAIKVYDKLLLILSDASMSSEWVSTEISKARKRERREQRRMLFPISLVPFRAMEDWECFDADAGKDSAREIREYFVPDFSNWKDHNTYAKAFEGLVRDLKAVAGE